MQKKIEDDPASFRIYEAIRWGNEENGPDGPDTIFLVHATSPEEAAMFADARLIHLPHNRVAHFAQRIHELGLDTGSSNPKQHGPLILRGPYYEFASSRGWRTWDREIATDQWLEKRS